MPLFPIDEKLNPERVSRETKPVGEWLKHLEMLRSLARECYKDVETRRNQVRASVSWYTPTIGALVWLYLPHTKQAKSNSRKLHNPWTGPWEVIALDSGRNNVELRHCSHRQERRTVHLSRIKEFKGRRIDPLQLPDDLRVYQLQEEEESDVGLPVGLEEEGHSPMVTVDPEVVNHVDEASEQSLSEAKEPGPMEGTTDVFRVEDIVGHEIVDGWYRYKVKWWGYPLEDDKCLPYQRLRAPGVRRLLSAYMKRVGITSHKVKHT